MFRAVPRDLFPLPLDPLSDGAPRRRLGRSAKQRLTRDTACRGRINRCLFALNGIYGCKSSFDAVRPSEAQCRSISHIEECVRRDSPPEGFVETGEASLSAMLGEKACPYFAGGASVRVAPLTGTFAISWPDSAGSAQLVDCVPRSHVPSVVNVQAELLRPLTNSRIV